MKYVKITVGPLQVNSYILWSGEESCKDCVIIDPGYDGAAISSAIAGRGLAPTHVLLTHGHYEHTGAIGYLRNKYPNIKVLSHSNDRDLLLDPVKSFAFDKIEADGFFEDGDSILVGDATLLVLHTPGHTSGSCCFYHAGAGLLFTGDTLFHESVGRHDLPTGDSGELLTSISNKLFKLPPKTAVLPGHMEDTTIEHEKAKNPYVRG
ncbi:MAG: MBL fold metallo-hydrolase [Defluviitaleaceae bacterium]|nr:MBL fold metallo-hydrolase [Defluviitaleaceae bacterium]